jgi:VWFA-related protein
MFVASHVAVCQAGEFALEKGKAEDLKGAAKVYVDAPHITNSLLPIIVEAIRRKLPQLTFVSVQEDADVLLFFSEEINKEIDDSAQSSASLSSNSSSVRSVVSVLKIRARVIRVMGSSSARLVGTFSAEGKPSNRNDLARDVAEEFINRYRKANRDSRADIKQPARRSGAPPRLGGTGAAGASAAASSQGLTMGNGRSEVGENEIVRIDTSLVLIHANVISRDGKPESELGREDFIIDEEGARQDIAFFEPIDRPFTVVLLIDSSSSVESRLREIAAAANTLISSLAPDDQVVVITFGNEITEVMKPTRVDKLRGEEMKLSSKGGTRLYDAVDFAISKYLRSVTGRKAVVLFTDGRDHNSFVATAEGNLHEAEELDALFYAVQYDTPDRLRGQINEAKERNERATAYLRAVAEKTGGRYYHADSAGDFAPALASIVRELSRQYTLGYYPRRQPQQGERRRIRVSVSRPGFVVRARDSYIFKPSEAERAKPE